MSTPAPDPGREKKSSGCGCGGMLTLGVILLFLSGIALGPIGGHRQASHNAAMQQARQIGQILFAYSTDNTANGNAYPDGKSSTEVFQKMIDGRYLADPAVLYVPLPGKAPAVAGQKLKPENVCFDVTAGVDPSSSDLVPLVFMTGYNHLRSGRLGRTDHQAISSILEYANLERMVEWSIFT